MRVAEKYRSLGLILSLCSGSGSDSGTIEHPRYLTEPRGKDGGKKKKKKRSASSSNAGIEGTPHLQRRLGQSISEDEL
jgi:hypothetical protein